jgi:WD40 repeat protein
LFKFILPKYLTDHPRSELQLVWQCQLSELVTSLACAPDGRGWAASSAAGEIVWNSGLDRVIGLQEADGQSIEKVAFSADGRWLAAGGQAGKLSIWTCEDLDLPPKLVQTLDIGKWIEHLVWHPSQPELAIGYGTQVKIWQAISQAEIIAWEFAKSVFDLAWQPMGSELAVAGSKGVRVGAQVNPHPPSYRLNVDTASISIAWSKDGRYLAAGNLDRTLTIVDWQQPENSWTLQGCPGKIRRLDWLVGTATPCLAVASGMEIGVWNLSEDATTWNGQLLEGHQGIIAALISHPHAPKFASGGADGYTCLWTTTGEIEQILNQPLTSGFTSLSWHPDDLYLATGTENGDIGIWAIPA